MSNQRTVYIPAAASAPSSVALKRIKKEISTLTKEKDLGGIDLRPGETDLTRWSCSLPGPQGSCYEGGVFEVQIQLPPDYPFSPPKLHFTTKIYHCNISDNGGICLDILKNSWSPALSVLKVILSLSSLLTDPNPSDPLVANIAQMYMTDRKQHDAIAQDWVQKFALPRPAAPSSTPAPGAPVPAPSTARASSSRRTTTSTPTRSMSTPQTAGSKRKKSTAATRTTSAGAGSSATETIELSDSEDEVTSVSTASERKRSRRDGDAGGSGGEGGGVIVLD